MAGGKAESEAGRERGDVHTATFPGLSWDGDRLVVTDARPRRFVRVQIGGFIISSWSKSRGEKGA
jgi:hypothetical protein